MCKRYRQIFRLSVIMAVLLIITGGGVLAVRRFLPQLSKLPFMPNGQVIDFHTYFVLDPAITGLILEDRRITPVAPPVVEQAGEAVYLPFDFVREYMDTFLFWDEYAATLYVTTQTDVKRYTPGAAEYWINNEKQDLKTPIKVIDETAYLPAELVSALYPFEIAYQPAYNMVIVTNRDSQAGVGVTAKKTDLRYRPDNKAPITKKTEKDETLTLYEKDGEYTRVRTTDGLLGYALTAAITIMPPAAEVPDKGNKTAAAETIPPVWPSDVKINLMWDVICDTDVPLPDGVNVISPTWFTFDVETIEIKSQGSRAYTDWAHAQECKVWALLADETGEISHSLLTNASARRRTVERLAQYADEYGLDGINIDFEHVREADGTYYVQFLRELAPVLRRKGIVLSVDVYVPSAWSAYYERGRVGQTVDFICVMTYDEHYSGSPESGPVASLPFVQKGVEDMLLEVPKNKLLMGLPFYNRVWREIVNNDSAETRKVQHYGMTQTKKLLADKGIIPEWDRTIGSYYGEFAAVEDGETVLYRVWMEEEESIAKKLLIFESNDLAGVAGWRRGLENEAVQLLLKNSCNLP